MVWIIGAILGFLSFIIVKLLQLQKNNNLVFAEANSGDNINNSNFPDPNIKKDENNASLDFCCDCACDSLSDGLSESLCNDCSSCCDC